MLPDTVREAARRFGDTPVIVEADGTPLSYRDLDRRSDATAAGMAARGLGPGDVVALTLPSCTAYAVAYAAAAKLGAVTAGVNDRLAPSERGVLLGLVEPRLVVDTPSAVDELAEPDSGPPPLRRDPKRPVAIVFTSGTTGVAKGAVFTDAQLEAAAAMEVGDAWGGGGPSFNTTPFPHVGFMVRFTWQLRLGGTLHLMERWTAGAALEMIERHRMKTVGGVPAQVALMVRHPEFDRFDLSSVEGLVVGAGPAAPGLRRDVMARFAAPLSVRFSCTESGGIGTGTAFGAPDDESLHTVGRPRAGVALSIRGDEGHEVPAGEVGEVCLRTPTAMACYWNDPHATARAFWRGGWLRTGDLGFVDGAGCLRLAGRTKEMYVRGGYNVYPAEVEAVLSMHPKVRDVAVVARTDDVMGEIGVAVVVPRSGAETPTLDELRDYASDVLASYKLPEDLRIVAELPLTAVSKIDRRALEAQVAS